MTDERPPLRPARPYTAWDYSVMPDGRLVPDTPLVKTRWYKLLDSQPAGVWLLADPDEISRRCMLYFPQGFVSRQEFATQLVRELSGAGFEVQGPSHVRKITGKAITNTEYWEWAVAPGMSLKHEARPYSAIVISGVLELTPLQRIKGHALSLLATWPRKIDGRGTPSG